MTRNVGYLVILFTLSCGAVVYAQKELPMELRLRKVAEPAARHNPAVDEILIRARITAWSRLGRFPCDSTSLRHPPGATVESRMTPRPD